MRVLKNYGFTIVLVIFIAIGAGAGAILKEKAVIIKPLGDIFLNLLFTIVVPMVFFSLASTVATMSGGKRLGKVIGVMICIFLATAAASALLMSVAVRIFPPAAGMVIEMPPGSEARATGVGEAIVKAVTVDDFALLISKKNMLALIIFSILTGLAAGAVREKAQAFIDFLTAGAAVSTRLMKYIMYYAPVGLGAYFAYLVGVFGPDLLGNYFRAAAIFYPVAMVYFAAGLSVMAFIAGGRQAVASFWKNIIPASLTAWGTCSSVAAVPANLEAAKRIKIPRDIREVIIPIGATIHMDGSCLAAILKIALLFGIFGMDYSGTAIITSVGVAILAGVVMSGIPGGGFLGELMIVTLYGFGPQALPIISMIGTLVDPPATMVNSSGDVAASMLSARVLEGPDWMRARALPTETSELTAAVS